MKGGRISKDVVRGLLLVLVVAGAWCLTTGRTRLDAWSVPLDYRGDAWHTLAQLKAAQDGRIAPLRSIEVAELNAPFAAGWNGFLRQHKLQYWLAGRLAGGLGLFATANLLVLLAAVLAAASFYGVARWFRARWEWAAVGGLAFALSPFFFYRALAHLTLTHFWPVPLAILVVTWAFGRRPWSPGRFAVAAAIAFVIGLHNVYYAGLFAQFLVLAALRQALARRPRAGLAAGALLAALCASVALDNLNLIRSVARGETQAIDRPYGNLERYALKPIELVVPLARPGLAPWSGLGEAYFRGALYRGEMGSAYLGLAGVAALGALVLAGVRDSRRRVRPRVPVTLLAVAWILAYSVVGGLNGIAGALGFVWFRATDRYSIWILALVLLWASVRLSRLPLRPVALRSSAALAAALVLADQLPSRPSGAELDRVSAVVASDSALVRSLESALPAGSMLFQLPVVESPEGPKVFRASDYEHLRPYLFASRLHFSYGADKGGAREAWQRDAEGLEPEPMAAALERMGFAGLLVNRKAYPDQGAELQRRLAAAGRREAWESADHEFLFVRLEPAVQRAAPDEVLRRVAADKS